MMRCPICRAKITDTSICYRCKADLNTLLYIEKEHVYWLGVSIAAAKTGGFNTALFAASKANALKQTEFSQVLIMFYDERCSQDSQRFSSLY